MGWLRYHRHDDDRGWLSEVFSQDAASALGLPILGQDNLSHSAVCGLVRGLHFQRPPFGQAKLFRVAAGRVFNVVVDLRPDQFGRVHNCEMTAETEAWIYIPAGFAHGFQALEDAVDVHYKVSGPFVPTALGAVAFDDPDLAIAWPLSCPRPLLSERDQAACRLEEVRNVFSSAV